VDTYIDQRRPSRPVGQNLADSLSSPAKNHPPGSISMREKICLGGSFNPIHHGHLICARVAAEAVGAKTIVVFPAGSPPHKPAHPDLALPQDRLEMCRRAVAGIPGFEIDDRELRRTGPSYTIYTARELRKDCWKEVSWLIGADMLNTLPSWHDAQALLREVRFIVMARPGFQFAWDALPTPFQSLRDNVVPVPQLDISSTDIRNRVRSGLPIDFYCPPAVCRYIHDHRLYQLPEKPAK
jgi:nicotinate-nucleotide adenylyltransferase